MPEIELNRLQGRKFSINSYSKVNKFNDYANIKFGTYNLGIIALDYDLILGNEEYPDVGAIRTS